jgi:hypothetical protein
VLRKLALLPSSGYRLSYYTHMPTKATVYLLESADVSVWLTYTMVGSLVLFLAVLPFALVLLLFILRLVMKVGTKPQTF